MKSWQPQRKTKIITSLALKAKALEKHGYPVAVIALKMGVARLTIYRWLNWIKANSI